MVRAILLDESNDENTDFSRNTGKEGKRTKCKRDKMRPSDKILKVAKKNNKHCSDKHLKFLLALVIYMREYTYKTRD